MRFSQIRSAACSLGFIDGLLMSVLTGGVIAFCVEYRNAQILEGEMNRKFLTEAFHFVGNRELIWLVCLGFFVWVPALTLSSWLIHKYLFGKIRSVIVLWEYVGILGVFVAFLLVVTAVEGDFLLRGRQYGESNVGDHLVPILKLTVAALVVVALINYLYGVALNMSPRLYSAFRHSASADHSTTIS